MALTRKKKMDRSVHQVLGILAQHFQNGKYNEGWNDRRIAAEAGVPKLLVTETRQWRLKPSVLRISASRVAG
jgi:hypothetical protein